jgi:cell division septation protein DedD
MEEQTSWKGHAFTLMIFGGIVVLCSIFFVLGMLVGRAQSVKLGTVATADAAPKAEAKESRPEEVPAKESRFEAAPLKPVPAPPARPSPAAAPAPPPATTINLQISALKNQSDAEKLVDDLKKKGFRAFILTPAPGDSTPYYRVQIGASDLIVAEALKQDLEAAGFKGAMIKK